MRTWPQQMLPCWATLTAMASGSVWSLTLTDHMVGNWDSEIREM
jgi:hypothetical protein